MQALMKFWLPTLALMLSAHVQARPVVLTDLDVQSLDSERIEILTVMRPRPAVTRLMIRLVLLSISIKQAVHWISVTFKSVAKKYRVLRWLRLGRGPV